MTTFDSTEVQLLGLPIGDRTLRLRLHLEGTSRFGSIKSRTAVALLDALEQAGQLRPGGHVVESTSGNLGVALAGLCAERGYRCTLVIDSTTSIHNIRLMIGFGAELIRLQTGNHVNALAERIRTVHEFLDAHPRALWTDQYNNPAGPAAHMRTTGPALLHHGRMPHPNAVVVPVSTGGTLAGTATFVREHAPEVLILAVDAVGSAATTNTAALRPYKLPGFGSGLKSRLLTAEHFDRVVYITDTAAAWMCRTVHAHTGIALGGSAGAAVSAAIATAAHNLAITDVACLCPDSGERYQGTIYAPGQSRAGDPAILPAFASLHRLHLENGPVK